MRVGVQRPTVAKAPRGSARDAAVCAELAAGYGLVLDEWQVTVLETWMRRTRGGRWAAGRWGLAVPRQNGKNGVLEAVELYLAAVLGLRILHTAHEVKTARKAFLRITSFFQNERQFPELASLAQTIRQTNGQEAIFLTNGGSIEFIARSKSSGRGFTVDVLVCDEAQEYGEDAQAALLPTISSAPSGDPVQILMGTPPDEGMDGDVFTRMRSQGVAKGAANRLAWVEWSVAGDVDVTDEALWYEANPALGIRLGRQAVADECQSFSPEKFARERLGMWMSSEQLAVIPAERWAARRVEVAPDGEVAAYGVDMNPERTIVRVCVAVPGEGGSLHLELADIGDAMWSTDALVQWLYSRARKRVPVVMDAFSPIVTLEPLLRGKGVKVWKLSGSELMQATGGFYDDVMRDRRVTHAGQEQLDAALAGAKKKKLGDAGGFKWDRKALDVDLTPLMAATAARFGATKSRARKRANSGGAKVVVLS